MPHTRVDPSTIPLIAERLRLMRLATGERQAEFCRRVGISQGAWNNYERGRDRISVDAAMALAHKLGVSLDWIYLGKEGLMPHGLMTRINEIRAHEGVPSGASDGSGHAKA